MTETPPKIESAVEEKIDQKIDAAKIKPTIESLDTAQNVASKTTAEQDLRTKGQREINLIWESTQRNIALFLVIMATTVSSVVVILGVLNPGDDRTMIIAAFTLLSNAMFLVSGFYFGRTNHARIGDDPQRRYKGGMDDR